MASVRDFALTTTGDLDIAGGGSWVSGLDAIAQEVTIRLKTFLGEYFLDTARGLPWLAWTGDEGNKMDAATLRQVEALVRAEAQETQGVVRVLPGQVTASYNSSTRTVTIAVVDVETDTGLLEVEVEV